MPENKICPTCDSIVKGDLCLNCGENLTADSEEDKSETPELKLEAVTSIFAGDIKSSSKQSKSTSPPKRLKSIPRFVLPVVLSLVLLAVGAASYWKFFYSTPEYFSPLVLSASESNLDDSAISNLGGDDEKTIALESKLKEGNFTEHNFVQFAAPDTTVFIEAFDIGNVFKVFSKDELYEAFKKDFEVTDDDLEVFFSRQFAVYYPEDFFDTWGFAINVTNPDYVKERIEKFNGFSLKKKYSYDGYFYDAEDKERAGDPRFFATLLQITVVPSEKGSEEQVEVVGKELIKENDEKKAGDKRKDETESEYYLLISNSKEYLDQMKESSEGNISNLGDELKYTQTNLELPKIGDVYVYKKPGNTIWDAMVDAVTPVYDYVGLDKILKAIKEPGVVFYSKDSKTKVVTADIM